MTDFTFRGEHVLRQRRLERDGRRLEHEADRAALVEAEDRRRERGAARAEGWCEVPEQSLAARTQLAARTRLAARTQLAAPTRLAALKAAHEWRHRALVRDRHWEARQQDLEAQVEHSRQRLHVAACRHEIVARLRSRLQERHRRDEERQAERERDRPARRGHR
jgi:hypothetical protein